MAPAISDQKKRALEALERRFAVDKDKTVQREERESKKSKGNPKEIDERRGKDRASVASPVVIDQPSSSSSRKGQVVFTSHTSRRDTSVVSEDVHPAYSEISEILDENLVGAINKASDRGDVVNKIVFDLLQHGDKGHKYTKGSIAMKIDNFVHLDNFVPRDGSLMDARVRALQSHSKRSKNHMTMRQHRKCGSLDLPKDFHNFNLFKPMHEMWKQYIIKVLKENREKQLSQSLLVADLHGAFLQVVPKHGSVFVFQAGCWKITLHGDNLSLRNSIT